MHQLSRHRPKAAQAIIGTAVDHFGRIDILIPETPASCVVPRSGKEIIYEDFEQVLDVHLRGAFHVARPAFPLMCKAGYGRIVLTSSINGLYGNKNVVNYCVAKAGILGLANVAALEGADEGVEVQVILPGAVTRMAEGLDTSAYPPMEPEMVAPVVGWLAHESCSITGEILSSMAGRAARAMSPSRRACIARRGRSNRSPRASMPSVALDVPLVFPPVPAGHLDHIRYSFGMAKGAKLTPGEARARCLRHPPKHTACRQRQRRCRRTGPSARTACRPLSAPSASLHAEGRPADRTRACDDFRW